MKAEGSGGRGGIVARDAAQTEVTPVTAPTAIVPDWLRDLDYEVASVADDAVALEARLNGLSAMLAGITDAMAVAAGYATPEALVSERYAKVFAAAPAKVIQPALRAAGFSQSATALMCGTTANAVKKREQAKRKDDLASADRHHEDHLPSEGGKPSGIDPIEVGKTWALAGEYVRWWDGKGRPEGLTPYLVNLYKFIQARIAQEPEGPTVITGEIVEAEAEDMTPGRIVEAAEDLGVYIALATDEGFRVSGEDERTQAIRGLRYLSQSVTKALNALYDQGTAEGDDYPPPAVMPARTPGRCERCGDELGRLSRHEATCQSCRGEAA